jgi:hypothetical protein
MVASFPLGIPVGFSKCFNHLFTRALVGLKNASNSPVKFPPNSPSSSIVSYAHPELIASCGFLYLTTSALRAA